MNENIEQTVEQTPTEFLPEFLNRKEPAPGEKQDEKKEFVQLPEDLDQVVEVAEDVDG